MFKKERQHISEKRRSAITTIQKLKKSSNTQFEDLANETIYEIFEYLDTYAVYQAFMDLNSRFRNLLMSSSLPLKINMKYLSKSNVQSFYKRFILPNLHRIDFLYLWNPFLIQLGCPSIDHLQHFLELKTLVLDNVLSENLLNHLTMLPNLHSLIINRTVSKSMQCIDLQSIICLSVLKYCKISCQGLISFDFSDHHLNKTSSIEHLLIHGQVVLDDLLAILSYFPKLSRLSIDHLFDIHYSARVLSLRRTPMRKVFDTLTHVYFNLNNITFDRFEVLTNCILKNIEVLRISTSEDREYLNARRWEQLILSSMTRLRIFDIQFVYKVENELDRSRCKELMKQFTSSFWTERQWYFAYQYTPEVHGDEEMFYSIQPYRRRSYMLVGINEQYNMQSSVNNNFNLVRHVHVGNEKVLNDFSFYFPNAHELTIGHNSAIFHDSIIKDLNHILHLQQLYQIIIDSRSVGLHGLLEILQLTPNCSKLIVNRIEIDKQDKSKLIRDHELFRCVSQTNQIMDLTVESACTLKTIQFLMKLFPRVQHLTIKVQENDLNSSVKFLLSASNRKTQHLISLNIRSTGDIWIEKIFNQLQLIQRADQISIQEINYSNSYLWW